MRHTLIGVSRNIEFELRNDYFFYLETQSQDFYTKNRTGDLMTRATEDLASVRMVLGPGIMWTSNTIVTTVFVVTAMLNIDVKLTLFALIPFPLLSYIIFIFGKKFHDFHTHIQEQFSKLSTKAQENLSGIRIIKAYSREESEVGEFEELSEEYVSRNKKLIKLWSLFFPVMRLMGGLGVVIVIWYGGGRVISGDMTLGGFVAFNGYLMMLLWPMIALGWVTNSIQRGAASMGRITEVMDQVNTIVDGPHAQPLEKCGSGIEIRNLTFAYPGTEKPALSCINLKIPFGTTCAVTGPTGSGKSTILNILARVSPVKDGCVFIDNMDINNIKIKDIRNFTGFVPQETFLFSESIIDNIRYGGQDNGVEEVSIYTSLAGIHKEIESFPDKYGTMLGERGINLSGGQKQRVALARALVKEPSLLMLDDALSAVDTETEELILKNLNKVMKDRSALIVSQRVSTIKHADNIIYLDDGMIKESGTHDELLKLNGCYASLYRKQLLSRELELENNE